MANTCIRKSASKKGSKLSGRHANRPSKGMQTIHQTGKEASKESTCYEHAKCMQLARRQTRNGLCNYACKRACAEACKETSNPKTKNKVNNPASTRTSHRVMNINKTHRRIGHVLSFGRTNDSSGKPASTKGSQMLTQRADRPSKAEVQLRAF